jgi:diguanylate cyclase (GGDEF)-like protein
LGIRFGQERYVYLAILFFSVFSILHLFYYVELSEASGNAALFFASLIIPFNIFLFYMLPVRGISSYDGIVRVLTVLLQAAALFILHGMETPWALTLSNRKLLFTQLPGWLAVPEPGLLLGLVIMSIMVFMWLKKESQEAQMMLALQLTGIVALNFRSSWFAHVDTQGVFVVMAGLCSIILLFNILESSLGTVKLDALTGLPGRKTLDDNMNMLTGLYSIAMVDIDHFKLINDKYGHETGDQVLKFLAGRLRTLPFGKAYRYGGEEFTIVAPGWDKKELQPLLDELRESIYSAEFYLRSTSRPQRTTSGAKLRQGASQGKRIQLSVSIGIAQVSKSYPTPEMVIIAADKALYKAKDKGRNCVELSHR